MATLSDRIFGGSLILLALAIFTYYTLWVVILPFLDPDHFLHSFFLPPVYAITLPLGGIAALFVLVGVFVATVMIKDRAKRKAKAKTK
ncbi:PREDICTED: dolichol phosphate-mannose biosynthesis regulatory protein-like [Amphimedon queenslandica]|uniref:Dolichol phosphate-mannose biosynthesis regulatory protein n=1 Tax=Amphimedon queenslandica TaxID=400682 RepID=A0A1X7V2K1_AMPQE|nr:PREDICTED: dolichol phosphate-mannose biosynthesis regulatory protein-like [Amphimedon queenslandica]|eukprot:XP_019850986.1 PREDICTED: dolichol phosphate-mannose biosynthesis regulatory protein-like [Amphimedon queenslandica]